MTVTVDSQLLTAWLQAGAAVLQAAVAIGLFVITRKYVVLTARLAAASEAQVELLRAERDQSHEETLSQFRSMAKMLLDRVRQLPGPGPEARQAADRLFRNAALPTDHDLRQIADLGASIGPGVGEVVRPLATHLAWMLNIAREIQATRPEVGYRYDRMDWNAWVFHWIEAESALAKLAAS